ncbi:PIN domain-containing protein [Variovorax sp. J22P240]|uniref:PIN domain-containing protein n=1 Tax=Variovorax sp. J22P240 TaxID=3053514 RepID=UPI002576C32C|nr:PIN domain-containing protein [Variovorax sp. J22P240]MDM0002508.1 PIN domain-containing protein [Variovorax sp. J22P240]
MTKTYLLIVLQNRKPSPDRVASWIGAEGEAWIFFGEQEISMLPKYQELGGQVSIVDISRPGKNSLDFHLVLYLGYLVGRRESNARFMIVAGDGDYDPAVAHARSKGVKVERVDSLDVVPVAVAPSPKSGPKGGKQRSVDVACDGILKDIRGSSRPRTLATLKTRIQSRIGQQPEADKVAAVIAKLEAMEVIKVVDGALNYVRVAVDSKVA